MYESNKAPYALGLMGQEIETEHCYIKPSASLPNWLNGSLVRVTPAKYQIASDSLKHWFDGLAMLYKFKFEGEQIYYKNCFLASDAYKAAVKNNRLSTREFATNPKENFFEKIIHGLAADMTDNTNVNIGELAGRCVAMSETNYINIFDFNTLQMQGHFKFTDNLKGHLTTAHPHYDIDKRSVINLLTQLGPKSFYQIYEIPYAGKSAQIKRNLIAKIPTDKPAYIHSFAISKKHIVLFEVPLRLDFKNLVFSGKPYIENYFWDKKLPTNIIIIDRDSGGIIRIETEPCFVFHNVNAYDVDNNIIVDFLRYDDASIIDALYINELQKQAKALPEAKLYRLSISLNTKGSKLEKLFDMSLELPQINYQLTNGKRYNYVYSAGTTDNTDFLNCLVKYDLSRSNSVIWHEENCYPGEPVFVSKQDTNYEDEGVVLSLVLNAKDKQSYLLILNAKSFSEIARAYVPNIVPFGFHGRYFAGRSFC
jgi:carotenoid cleavage dioxygenase-like enzyme